MNSIFSFMAAVESCFQIVSKYEKDSKQIVYFSWRELTFVSFYLSFSFIKLICNQKT